MSTDQPPSRRFVRRTDDRVVAGVASGLADLLGIDPVLVRVGFVVLAFVGGTGLIAYGLLWIFTPAGTSSTPVGAGARSERGATFWIAIVLFVLAAFAIVHDTTGLSILWPLVLIGAGIALWRSEDRPPHGPSTVADGSSLLPPDVASAPAPPPGLDETAVQPPPAEVAAPAPLPPAAPTVPAVPTVPTEPTPARSRSILPRLTVGAALLVVGILTGLDRAGLIMLTLPDAFAAMLIVVGLGLVVGTWFGRGRGLALLALLVLLPGLALSTLAHDLDVPLGAGVGQQSFRPSTVAAVEPLYEQGVGELTVDLSEIELARGGEVATTLRMGLGQIVVTVPPDVTVDVRWQVSGGQVELFETSREGQGLEGRQVFAGEPGAGTLVLDTSVVLGQIEVQRDRAPAEVTS